MRRSRVLIAVRRAVAEPFGGPSPLTIVSALSGGADSVALLHALATTARDGGIRVVAAHLDHGLRPDSADDAAFCRDLCGTLGVPLRTARADVAARAARDGDGIEQAARVERYGFLRAVKAEEGAAVIALAHTSDDQAETLLLHLLRGSGSVGLGGMRARSRDLLRPLLHVSRADVLAHLAAEGLRWRDDPSNADLGFTRNRVRHELIPYLERHFNPRVRQALARTAGLLADEADVLGQQADALYARAVEPLEDALALSRSVLRDAPPAVARRAVRRALDECGGLAGVDATCVQRLLRLCCDRGTSGRRLPLPGGREALVRFDRLVIGRRRAPAMPFAAPLVVPGRVALPDGRTMAAEVVRGPATSTFEHAVVSAPSRGLQVRTRRPGDRIRTRGGEVSLKRFLIEKHVPADVRPGLPLVADGSRIVWVPGLAADENGDSGGSFVRLRLEPAEGGA